MDLRFFNRIIIHIRNYVYLVCLTFIVVLAAVGLSSVYFSHNTKAHPGNTASDGCHYCWTNCDYWGEVYGERHCHGGTVEYMEPEEYYPEPEPDYDYPEVPEGPDGSIPASSTPSSATDTATTAPSTDSDSLGDNIWGWLVFLGLVLFYPLIALISWLWEWVHKQEW